MSTSLPPNPPESSRPETASTSPGGALPFGSIFSDVPQHRAKRAAGATVGSIAVHALLIGIGMFLLTRPRPTAEVEDREVPIGTLVFIESVPGPGGGGGGSPEPAPPKPTVIPRTEPPKPEPVPIVPPPPVPRQPPPPTLSVPVMTTDAAAAQATGTSQVSLASYGGGGRGVGLGPGRGDGVGPGTGTGFGGGVARPGAGINNPRVLREQRPGYTSEAMRAKIQGNVELEVVVLADGSVGDVRVTKSLDKAYGLDQEAVKAAKLWRFVPATDRTGKPVPILVTIVLSFTIH
jgi:protein TonB